MLLGGVELRQPVGVAFLPEGEIVLHALICAAHLEQARRMEDTLTAITRAEEQKAAISNAWLAGSWRRNVTT